MNKTIKNKKLKYKKPNKIKSKTKKNTFKIKQKPSLKTLQKNSSLYASKKFGGKELLEFTQKNEFKTKKTCLLENLSWFGSYNVAKSYQTHETKLYEWKIKTQTHLLNMNERNNDYFHSLFLKDTTVHLTPAISFPKNNIDHIKDKYAHPYLNMNTNERAYYEFCFVFGYLTVEEQYEFMQLLKYLLEEKIIEMNMRNGKSILNKLNIKIYYYKLSHTFANKKKCNRLSFYDLDKHAVLNVCKLVKSKNIGISGLYQGNTDSFWFPNLTFYKMNIEETILFNPHHNLVFDKLVE